MIPGLMTGMLGGTKATAEGGSGPASDPEAETVRRTSLKPA